MTDKPIELTPVVDMFQKSYVVNTDYWQNPYPKMDLHRFHILRPPSTKRYIRMVNRLRRYEQKCLDNRWNLWHDLFKRGLFYRTLRFMFKLLKKVNLL